MAAFDLVPSHPLVSPWTRLFKSGAAGTEEISIHRNLKIKLRQSGDAGTSGTMPAIYSGDPSVADISDARGAGNDTQTFTLEAKGSGRTVLNGKTPTGVDCVYPLNVIAGNFANHTGTSVDLLADKLAEATTLSRFIACRGFSIVITTTLIS